jgi:hypothetical protein
VPRISSAGAWGWYALLVVLAVFNTVLGEELLFLGLLLPRMRGAFGKYDWVANGVLFATYHLHQPWDIPTSLVDIVALSYPRAAVPKRVDGDHRALDSERLPPHPCPYARGLGASAQVGRSAFRRREH